MDGRGPVDLIWIAGVAGAAITTICAASLHAPAILSVLYVLTRQYFMAVVSVPAAQSHCVSAPVTVANVAHVLPSVLFWRSAFVCAVFVSMMCAHWKSVSVAPSTTVFCGERTFAADVTSTVDSVAQFEVTVYPPSAVATTCHWISSVVNVPPGTVRLLVDPAMLISFTVPVALDRHRKVAAVCVTDMYFSASYLAVCCVISHENTVGAFFAAYPDAGDISRTSGPLTVNVFHALVKLAPAFVVPVIRTSMFPTGNVLAGT